MDYIGRNELCPCGSGQKYKKCCLARDKSYESRRYEEVQAVQAALAWLEQNYQEEVEAAVDTDFMDQPDEDKMDAINALSYQMDRALSINIGEWLLTDATLAINGKDVPAKKLILGKGGPLLTAHGREWLQELEKRPLALYEVREVMKGKGVLLTDMMHLDRPPVQVKGKAAASVLVPWDTFGARLVRRDDSFVLSGSMYPMERETALDCLAEIRNEIKHWMGKPAIERDVTTLTIIDYWLNSILETNPLPRLVDASTGDKIDLTTDHYRVNDWEELERILDVQSNVEGNRNDGWTRFVELEHGISRSRATLEPKEPNTLKVFCRTLKLAEEARNWLEEIAGSVISYKIREIVDPRSEKVMTNIQTLPESDIPQDMQRQIIHKYLAQHYETWPEIPLPALEGKSPLEAVKIKLLRPAVIELLKSIDQLEARRIEETGGEPFDVSFLWERLGLKR